MCTIGCVEWGLSLCPVVRGRSSVLRCRGLWILSFIAFQRVHSLWLTDTSAIFAQIALIRCDPHISLMILTDSAKAYSEWRSSFRSRQTTCLVYFVVSLLWIWSIPWNPNSIMHRELQGVFDGAQWIRNIAWFMVY